MPTLDLKVYTKYLRRAIWNPRDTNLHWDAVRLGRNTILLLQKGSYVAISRVVCTPYGPEWL